MCIFFKYVCTFLSAFFLQPLFLLMYKQDSTASKVSFNILVLKYSFDELTHKFTSQAGLVDDNVHINFYSSLTSGLVLHASMEFIRVMERYAICIHSILNAVVDKMFSGISIKLREAEIPNRVSKELKADWQTWQSCKQLHCL